MKIVIVGAVAGGASAAARVRRLSEEAEIVMFERGAEPSFANCGLPYYIGGEIAHRSKLLIAPKSLLIERFRIDVRTHCNVESIDRQQKRVQVHDRQSDQRYEVEYDKLVLSPGARPFRPETPGINSPKIYLLRDLTDADALLRVTTESQSALIVGAGFIGIEMAENLVRRGLRVTLVELADQILPPWDKEMVQPLEQHLRAKGVELILGDSAEEFADEPTGVRTSLKSGKQVTSDFAVLCIGVRPENQLAQDAEIECGPRGGIRVNKSMQTSDPDIYAVGDAVEVTDFVTGAATQIPLAGPANRQGRIAADHIFGRASTYRGTQGTAVVGLFGRTAAMTGMSEKQARRMNVAYQKIYIHPAHHAGYYPGAEGMSLKLLFDPGTGQVLGAQAVGGQGVDKRIDVIAMAIQARMTVYDLEEVELCYAPQFGSAKDPVNMAGFVAAGVMRGDHPVLHVDELHDAICLIDVRTPAEYQSGHIPGARNIPLDELRSRLGEIPRDTAVVCYCKVGQRGYNATRILLQRGYRVSNLSGGITTWQAKQPVPVSSR